MASGLPAARLGAPLSSPSRKLTAQQFVLRPIDGVRVVGIPARRSGRRFCHGRRNVWNIILGCKVQEL